MYLRELLDRLGLDDHEIFHNQVCRDENGRV
jgi:hypothetical protein